MSAAASGTVEVVDLLLLHAMNDHDGGDDDDNKERQQHEHQHVGEWLECVDERGWSALHHAAFWGHVSTTSHELPTTCIHQPIHLLSVPIDCSTTASIDPSIHPCTSVYNPLPLMHPSIYTSIIHPSTHAIHPSLPHTSCLLCNSVCHQLDVVQRLMEAGCDPTLTNKEGQTPVDLAVMRGHIHCTQALEVGENERATQIDG